MHQTCNRKSRLTAILIAILLNAAGCTGLRTTPTHIAAAVRIGTGSTSGLYYPTGGIICQLFDKADLSAPRQCVAEVTTGSGSNIDAIRNGAANFGIVQENLLADAYSGKTVYASDGPHEELRALFSLFTEQFTLVTRREDGITGLGDLKGKRVNIGVRGSGQYATVKVLLDNAGWNRLSFEPVSDFTAAEHSRALCAGDIDAFVYIVGHPNASVTEADLLCGVSFIDVDEEYLTPLLDQFPYFVASWIPAGLYRDGAGDIRTFGIRAALVTHEDTPEETVYALTRSVFENLDQLRGRHPVLKGLEVRSMIDENVAPLHPGALQYYTEQGWISRDTAPTGQPGV